MYVITLFNINTINFKSKKIQFPYSFYWTGTNKSCAEQRNIHLIAIIDLLLLIYEFYEWKQYL